MPIKKRHLEDCIVDHEKYQLAKNRNSKKYLTDIQLKSFLEQLEKNCETNEGSVYSILGYFLAFTGCRVAEACALTWQDINLISKGASISRSVMWPRRKGTELCISNLTKSGENRIVPLMDVIIEKLNLLKQESKREMGLVFSLDGFTPLGYRSIQYQFNKALKGAGIDWRSCHIFRHTFATMFMTLTGREKSLQGILGHKTSKMTDHYAKLTDQLREQGMVEFEGAISSGKVLYFKRPAG